LNAPLPAPLPASEFLKPGDATRLLYAVAPPHGHGAVAQLIAARTGEGTSSLCRDLALIAARRPDWRVLLLDLDPPGRSQANRLRAGLAESATQPIPGMGDVVIHRLGRSQLHVSEMLADPPVGAAWLQALPLLRTSFNLVLIDSPPLQRAFDGVMLAPSIDTTIIVVQAEATRAAVAQNLRDRIRELNGRIAGVVLNKRRFHIPQMIYERL